jgi:hypothetical protein
MQGTPHFRRDRVRWKAAADGLVAISNAVPMSGIVLPNAAADRRAIVIKGRESIPVEIDAVMTPVAMVPVPEGTHHDDA